MINDIKFDNDLKLTYNYVKYFSIFEYNITLFSNQNIDKINIYNFSNYLYVDKKKFILDFLEYIWDNIKIGYILLIETDDSYSIINDFISPSLYYYISDNQIRLALISDLDSNIISDNYEDFIRSEHWLINRSPFKSLHFGKFIKIPPGSGAEFLHKNYKSYNSFSLFPALYQCKISKSKYEHYYQYINRELINTINHLKENNRFKLGLSYSGGVDSTLLLSSISKSKYSTRSLVVLHNIYTTNKGRIYYIVKDLSDFFNISVKYYKSTKIYGKDKFKWKDPSKVYYIAYPNDQGGKMPNSSDLDSLGIEGNTAFLHGQNADTLMLFDTFAPSTQLILVERLKGIFLTINLRLIYFTLSKFRVNLTQKKNYKKYLNYFSYLFYSNDEHVKFKFKFMKMGCTGLSPVQKYRYFHQVVLVRRSISSGFDYFGIDKINLSFLELLKWYRFYRTVSNTIDNYNIIKSFDSIHRIPIFVTSNILIALIKYPYSILDILSPKFIFNKIIRTNNDLCYRSFIVRSVLKYFIKKFQ